MIIGWIDLERADPVETCAVLAKATNDPNLANLQPTIKSLQATLTQYDCSKVYVVADFSDLFGGQPKLVLPSGKPETLKQVLTAIAPHQRVDVKENCVVLASPNAQVASDSEAALPEAIVNAITNNTYAVALTIAPSRALRHMLPVWSANTPPSDMTSLDSFNQVDNLRVLSIGLDTDTFSAKVSATMNSPDAAKAATEWLVNIISEQLGTQLPVAPTATGNTAELVFTNRDQLVGLITELHTKATTNARRTERLNDFRDVMLGFHNFHASYNRLPPQAIVDAKGKRLLSWRVALLPFIGENELWSKFHLDEPWDSPNNKPLIEQMPQVYAGPLPIKEGKTTMVAPMTKDTAMGRPGDSTKFKNITDGLSNTIGVVNATQEAAVIWSKPDDLPVDQQNWKKHLVSDGEQSFIATMWDGSVRRLSADFDTDLFFKLLTIDGAETYDPDALNGN
ncbi:DUF1559 domain-containing protein [Stieleria sp. JC731]|uniref:DUF1559 family PulG-like putative transporter n=1 Tax=Pirellulaceae TaxID=2691357 RepID=UPI001E65C75D|nr:DUF1559 domain-containing protein [Stieleria sp. JC731]MCC9600273.1 DUF1559 domain-containing protein [Stieleria sp. JC731]